MSALYHTSGRAARFDFLFGQEREKHSNKNLFKVLDESKTAVQAVWPGLSGRVRHGLHRRATRFVALRSEPVREIIKPDNTECLDHMNHFAVPVHCVFVTVFKEKEDC